MYYFDLIAFSYIDYYVQMHNINSFTYNLLKRMYALIVLVFIFLTKIKKLYLCQNYSFSFKNGKL